MEKVNINQLAEALDEDVFSSKGLKEKIETLEEVKKETVSNKKEDLVQEISSSVNRWKDVHSKENVVFPLRRKTKNTNNMLSYLNPKTEFEVSLLEQMEKSKNRTEEQIKGEENNLLEKYSEKEKRRRLNLLIKEKEIKFSKEKKAERRNKIKSKRFQKIRKMKKKQKNNLKENLEREDDSKEKQEKIVENVDERTVSVILFDDENEKNEKNRHISEGFRSWRKEEKTEDIAKKEEIVRKAIEDEYFGGVDTKEEIFSENKDTKETSKESFGWNEWCGPGSKNKRSQEESKPTIEKSSRVIINQEEPNSFYIPRKKSSMYKTYKEYSKEMKRPIGREWNTETEFKVKIKPKVKVHAGWNIEPPTEAYLKEEFL